MERTDVLDGEKQEVDPLDLGLDDAEMALLIGKVDLSVPAAPLEEFMAAELCGYLQQYHTSVLAQRAARHNAQHDKAEKFEREIVYCRTAVALIQRLHPNAKARADSILKANVKRAEDNRKGVLKEEAQRK